MTNGKVNNFLIPNISKLPSQKSVDKTKELNGGVNKDEFKNLLNEQIGAAKQDHGISLSVHAAKRLQERNLTMDNSEFFKLRGAMDKLKQKGGQDSLVITDKAAYIVDVPNNKVVTAMDKENMVENVFTKIDSTVFMN